MVGFTACDPGIPCAVTRHQEPEVDPRRIDTIHIKGRVSKVSNALTNRIFCSKNPKPSRHRNTFPEESLKEKSAQKNADQKLGTHTTVVWCHTLYQQLVPWYHRHTTPRVTLTTSEHLFVASAPWLPSRLAQERRKPPGKQL